MESKDLLTINQVALFLQVSRSQVYEFFNDKVNPLPYFHLSERKPRVRKIDLDEWIENQILRSKEEKGGE